MSDTLGIVGSLPIAPTAVVNAAPDKIAEIVAALAVVRDAIPVPLPENEDYDLHTSRQVYARIYLNMVIRELEGAVETLNQFKRDMSAWGIEYVSELIAAPDGAKE